MPENTILTASIGKIRHQTRLMKENLAEGKLMPALKNCLTFLGELRLLAFSPKEYYELYMAVFDALDAFSAYLLQSHTLKLAKRKEVPFLTDLYELVQYSGNIIPRLYLMIVVGTCCMAAKNRATKDIMRDMIEMCRGVQHPIRGLFLRHYLCQRTRDLFPLADMADFDDTVDFLVTNFVEMNKLWVRLQHQGHSSERALRYQERKELKILVGSNLVRLSQVIEDFRAENYSPVEYYAERLFPTITEQIIQCKDHLAQGYLVDVVVQIFPDHFHFATLDRLLNEVFVKLHPMLKKSDLVASLVERFVNYKRIEAEMGSAANTEENGSEEPDNAETSPDPEEKEEAQAVQKLAALEISEAPSPISVDAIFTSFWTFYTHLRTAEPPLPLAELVPVLQQLVKLLLAFDAEDVLHIDKIYQAAALDLQEHTALGSADDDMQRAWTDLLRTPVEHFASVKRLLDLPFFYALYSEISSVPLKKQLACDIAHKLLASYDAQSPVLLSTQDDIDNVFKFLSVLIEDPGTQPTTSKALGVEPTIKLDGGEKLVTPEFLHVQETVCKVLHLVGHPDEFRSLANLLYTKKKYLSKAPHNIVHTYPALVTKMTNALRVAGYRILSKKKGPADQLDLVISSNFKNISVVIDELYQHHQQFGAEQVLRLYLNLASVADQLRQENIAYELFSQCFVVYEENLVLLPAGHVINPHDTMGGAVSYQAVVLIANRLASLRYFSKQSYEALITKVTLYGSKLLKKQDQCRAIYQCAHLWWWCDLLIEGTSPTAVEEKPEPESNEGTEKIESTENTEKTEKPKLEESENPENPEKSEEGADSEVALEKTQKSAESDAGPLLYRDAKRVLECLQKALRVADSCMDPYLLLKLFVEILNRCLIFSIYDNWMVDARYIGGLVDLVRTNFANFEDNHLSAVDDDQEARLLGRIEALFQRTLDYLGRQQDSDDRLREIAV